MSCSTIIMPELSIMCCILLLVMSINIQIRRRTFHAICISMICLLTISLINEYGYFEFIRLLLKLDIKDLLKIFTTRFRLSSSKSLPSLEQLNIKASLHAIYVRFIMKFVSPVSRYLMWIKNIWSEIILLVKLGCIQTHDTYYA